MPARALSTCTYPGCPNLVKGGGRCSEHAIVERSHYDRQKHRLYGTKQWHALRAMQLRREPWCADCLAEHAYTAAEHVDHIVPHHGDRTLFFDPANLQSLCSPHHTAKTNRERGQGEGGSKSLEPGAATAGSGSDFCMYGFGVKNPGWDIDRGS